MKIEKAIEITLDPESGSYYDNTENICEALQKHIPMEVVDVHVDEYYCPACGAENSCCNGKVEDNYCPRCGQALRGEKQ